MVKQMAEKRSQLAENVDWKFFFIKYKWMPRKVLRKKFGIKTYDIDNFLQRPQNRQMFKGCSISESLPPDRLQEILKDAWEYYLIKEIKLNIREGQSDWIPEILRLSNVEKKGDGFSFLVNSKYLRKAFGNSYQKFRSRGYTRIAFALFNCFPGEALLTRCGVEPFMFNQTKRIALKHIDILSMIEHIYWNFSLNEQESKVLESSTESEIQEFMKERFISGYKTPGFLSSEFLNDYGLRPNLYKDIGLGNLKSSLKDKYKKELGDSENLDDSWSKEKFARLYPDIKLDRCKYCPINIIDHHHFLPRPEYPQYEYHRENVIPLCTSVHAAITRNKITKEIRAKYEEAIKHWLKDEKASLFDNVLKQIHEDIGLHIIPK